MEASGARTPPIGLFKVAGLLFPWEKRRLDIVNYTLLRRARMGVGLLCN
jgi:hypothetical protein